MPTLRATLVLLTGIALVAIPELTRAVSLEPADPELRAQPAIEFGLRSTLPGLPQSDTQFRSDPIDPDDPIAYVGPLGPDVLHTGYQTAEETDVRKAASRALREVAPSDEVR